MWPTLRISKELWDVLDARVLISWVSHEGEMIPTFCAHRLVVEESWK